MMVGGGCRRSGCDLTQEALLGDKMLDTCKCVSARSQRHACGYRTKRKRKGGGSRGRGGKKNRV